MQISGIGAVSCAGNSADALWRNALAEHSGISDGVGIISNTQHAELRAAHPRAAHASKPVLYAYAAMTEAMRQAGWAKLNDDDGLILATTTGQIPAWEGVMIRFLKKQATAAELASALRTQSLGSITAELSELLDFRGRSFLTSSACAASTQGLALAVQWLTQGKVKRVLVGGTEVLCNLTLEGFRSLQLMSPLNSTPFDVNRKGINLSEAAAFICLEPTAGAVTAPLAKLTGFGLSTDGYHMTAPHPEGRGIFEAMNAALRTAALAPHDISWVHAHGTGSRHNDQAEGAAITRLFRNDHTNDRNDEQPWTSSTKWVHGHALGASGALETALCVQALLKQTILKTSGLKNPDPAIALRHPAANAPMKLRHILKTTLGFGGSNAALVISEAGA